MRRRKFLQMGATAAAAGTTLSCTADKSPWRSLTVEEASTLEALCEQIIPADRDAGATQAGVVRYIDLQLAGFYKPFRAAYRQGLADLVAMRFTEMPAERKTAVLTELDGSAKAFFEMVVSHTMQGFYGGPRHGGNRDAVSWRMLGVPVPPVRGRAQYDFRKG
jgi:gluconate 2-dehydrogenase gamma chain